MEATLTELLEGIGLSTKEARLYLTLLRTGTQPISVLARRAKMNRGTTYVILHALLSKGLAMKSTRRKVIVFAPVHPRELLSFLKHQQQDLRQKQEKVQGLLGKLIAVVNPFTATPKIEFFEGAEGARRVLDDTLTSKERLLRAFLSIADTIEFTGFDYFDDYTTRRIQSGYTLHAIRTLEKDKLAFAAHPKAKHYVTSRKERREIRYATEDLAFPVTMYMYDDKLAVVSSKVENFALIIQSKELSDMQVKLFELLWNSLRARERSRGE